MKYGYIRVSTRDQNIDRQLSAMLSEGIEEKYLYIDQSSGKNFNRRAYKQMLAVLMPGDELVIKSIDRLGRNYDEIIKQWNYLVKEKKVDIVVLDFPLLNTNLKIDTITGKFISDLCLQVLSYVAQVERENIKKRQLEGIVEAKKKGIKFGRPNKTCPKEFPEIIKRWKRQEITVQEVANQFKVSKSTVYRWLKNKVE
ncbi:resolvase [Streptococcus cuniculi]|uniref:Resolvase n=1 Tax=Streptococcus cuniculi TaxID=1432788 RepID=A0A1Q8E7P7_9STRE|nr:recombinase family protein [Streptococcus cuniculi]OLF47819.1 resolvase [Streptococcus cuniculi]